MKAKELRQKRHKLLTDCRQIVDDAEKDGRSSLNADEREKYDKLWADAEELKTEIERVEQLEAEERSARETLNPHRNHRDDATDPPAEPDGKLEERALERFASYRVEDRHRLRRLMPEGEQKALGELERRAFNNFLAGREMAPLEKRALQMDIDTAGGYIVAPQQWMADLIKFVDNEVFVRRNIGQMNIIQVPMAASLGMPSLENDPADPTWVAEIDAGSADSTMSLGKRELYPHPLAQYIVVSKKLLRSSALDAEELVRNRLGYKLGIVQENAYLNGTGVNQPLGVFVASNNGIPTGRDVSTDNTTTAMTPDGIKNAKFTLKGQYWPTARWCFHRDGVKQVSKFKDGEGRYMWQDGLQAGEPDRLLGFPVDMSEYAPNTFTTGQYVGILASWPNGYKVADALDMTIQRLVELKALTNQDAFLSRYEGDGMPVLGEAFVRVKLG